METSIMNCYVQGIFPSSIKIETSLNQRVGTQKQKSKEIQFWGTASVLWLQWKQDLDTRCATHCDSTDIGIIRTYCVYIGRPTIYRVENL